MIIMFNDTLQHYLEQEITAKVVLTLLAIGLIVSIIQLSTIEQGSEVLPKKEIQAHAIHQAFVPTPLFGQSPTIGVLQQTRLNLTLKGTFAASDSTTGSAVIATKDKGDRIYIVGDLVEGATINDIQPDYVVLEYQGNKEILRLPRGND